MRVSDINRGHLELPHLEVRRVRKTLTWGSLSLLPLSPQEFLSGRLPGGALSLNHTTLNASTVCMHTATHSPGSLVRDHSQQRHAAQLKAYRFCFRNMTECSGDTG